MASPRVHVLFEGDQLPAGLTRAISRLGATASFARLRDAIRDGVRSGADAIVVVDDNDAVAVGRMDVLLRRIARQSGPTLILRNSAWASAMPVGHRAPVEFSTDRDEIALAERLRTLIARVRRAAVEMQAVA